MNTRNLATGTLVAVSIALIIALVVLFNSFTIVDAGTRGVVKTFGEVTGVFEEGLHFRAPFVTSVVPVDVKTRRYESNSSAASRDLQIVTTQVVLNYHPDPATVGTLVRDIGIDYEPKVIDPAIQESVKAATARFTAEELITQRPLVSESIRDVLGERLTPRGIVVEDLSITEFNFSPEFSKAIEAKQVAEQDALRAERELRRVQIEAQQQVAQAEAQAEARLMVAKAEAEGLRLQREVISPALLQLRFIEKWNGVLPRFSAGDGGVVPMITIPQEELQEAQSPPAPATAQPAASPEAEAPAAPTPTTTP
jgi:regulator of protease activity HflC (stomatin/prohibitin superfamily)